MTQKRLDDSNIGTALKQMGRKAVAQRVQRHALLDSGSLSRLMEQAAQLAGRQRLAGLTTRKQPAFLRGHSGIGARWSRLPPLAQQIEHLRRQHDIAVLAAFGLLDPNDLLRAVDMLDLQPDHLAGTQAAAVAKAEQHPDLEVLGDGQQPFRLVRAHYERNLLRLPDVVDLGSKVQPPQRHAKQKPQPGHDAIAIADARAALGKVQLEAANVLRCRRVWRSLQECRELLAAADMAPLRASTQLACVHVLDHALTQRADRIRTHGQRPSSMSLTTPRSSRKGAPLRYPRAPPWLAPAHTSRPLARIDLVLWPEAAKSCGAKVRSYLWYSSRGANAVGKAAMTPSRHA